MRLEGPSRAEQGWRNCCWDTRKRLTEGERKRNRGSSLQRSTFRKGGVRVGDVNEEAEEEKKKGRRGIATCGVGIRRERPPRHPSSWRPSGGEFCNLETQLLSTITVRRCVVARRVGWRSCAPHCSRIPKGQRRSRGHSKLKKLYRTRVRSSVKTWFFNWSEAISGTRDRGTSRAGVRGCLGVGVLSSDENWFENWNRALWLINSEFVRW